MQRQWIAVVAVLLAFAAFTPSSVFAQPADLPGSQGIECGGDEPMKKNRLSIELGLSPRGITLKVDVTKAPPEAPVLIDPMLPACLEQLLHHFADVWRRPDRFVNVEMLLSRFAPAWANFGRARPSESNDTSEEQGGGDVPIAPEQAFRDMYRRTVPLGLVEVSH